MMRVSLLLSVGVVAAMMSAEAQGIRGVTRRTTTQERQQPARQFFDAAGISTTGAGPVTGPAAAGPQLAGQAKPTPQPLMAGKPSPAVAGGVPRPYVLGPAKPLIAGGGRTNVARPVAATKPAVRRAAKP